MIEKVLVSFSLLVVASCMIDFDDKKSLQAANFELQPLIFLRRTTSYLPVIAQEPASSLFFSLTVRNKSKKKAYDLFKYRYSKIQGFLAQKQIHLHDLTLVKTKVKSRHIPRVREWEFKVLFTFSIPQTQVQFFQAELFRLNSKKVQTQSDILYLEEKLNALKLFASAKAEVEAYVKEIEQSLRIVEFIDIRIEGISGESLEQKIQSELQNDFLEDYQSLETNSIIMKKERILNHDMEMLIIFKIGIKQDRASTKHQEDSESEESEEQVREQ